MIRVLDLLPGRRRVRSRIDGLTSGPGAPSRLAGRAGRSGGPPVEVVAGATVAVVVLIAVVGMPMTVLLGGGGGAGFAWWRWHQRRERARARQAQLPEALERLAGALRSGSSLPQGLAEAGRSTPAPLGLELTELAEGTTRGRALLEALDGWTRVHDDHGTRLAATALALAAAIGAAPARAVDGVATSLRERLEVAAERHALATQARTSALVLSAAPVGFALLLGLTDAAAARFLLATPLGWACLTAGIALDLTGLVWMTRLTQAGEAL